MNENMESKHALLIKWFRILLYIHIASIVNSLISYLPVPGSLTTWASRAIMVGVIICMFQLVPVNARYKKAAIYRGVMLACTLITAFIFQSTLLTLVASVYSLLALYQEYSGHSELIADKDPKLSRKWHSLFHGSLLTAILVSFGSVFAVLFVAMLEMDAVRASAVIVGVLSVPQLVIDVIYLLYLKKMIQIFQEEGEVYHNDV